MGFSDSCNHFFDDPVFIWFEAKFMGERRQGRSFASTGAVRKSQVFGTSAFHWIARNGSKKHQKTSKNEELI